MSMQFEIQEGDPHMDRESGDTGSIRSGASGLTGGSLHDSHSRYMSMYSIKCDDEVLRLGNEVPNFDAKTTHGPINFHKWKRGKWAVLFSHPADYTPVCTTELAALAVLQEEFASMDCKLAALSVDPIETHKEWIKDIVAHTDRPNLNVEFPIISDTDRYISTIYGMLDQWADPFHRVAEGSISLTVRSVFIINPENKLMVNLTYPACVGRNMNEIVRCVKALQLSYNKSVATPADWPNNHSKVALADGTTTTDYKGSVFLLPSVTPEEANEHYPDYYTCEVPSKKRYLRLVKAEDVETVPKYEPKDHGVEDALKRYRRKQGKKNKGLLYWLHRLTCSRKSDGKKRVPYTQGSSHLTPSQCSF